jgi:tetratricopeptide (TPR) repeat protein
VELQELAARARNAFLLRDWVTAEKFAAELKKQKPDHPGVLLFLGNIYTKMGRYNLAIQAYQESLELDERNPEAHNNIGIVYRMEENLPAAVGALERAREIAPDRADIWYNLANIYKQMEEDEEAETYYRKALEIDPGLTRAYNNLGNLYQTRGRNDEAEKYYTTGLEQDSNNPVLRYNLGITYQAEERIPEAIEAYRHALRSRPNWVDGLNNLGILLEQSGNYEEAARVLTSALKVEKNNPKLNNNMGVVLGALGNHREAVSFLKRAVSMDPQYTTAGLNLGTELEELGEFDTAWEHLQALKEAEPADLDIRERIARLAVRSNRARQARDEIRFILDHNPQAAFAYALLGQLYLNGGDRKRAIQAFTRAVSLDPDDTETSLNLALLYKELKEYERGIAQVSTILARTPGHYAARLLLGKLYLNQTLYTEALALLTPLYEEQPYDEDLLETLIRAHKGAGNREEALRITEELVNLQSERDETLDLDKLDQTLHLYEEAIEAYAEEHERRWEENLRKFTTRGEPEVEPEEIKEEESLFFDAIPDLDKPAKIIDVGGIEPVIVINEDEEHLRLKEMEEEIPPLPEEEKEEEAQKPAGLLSAAREHEASGAGSPEPGGRSGDGGKAGETGGGKPADSPAAGERQGFGGTVEINMPIQTPLVGSVLIEEHGIRRLIRRLSLKKAPPRTMQQSEAEPQEQPEESPAELLKYLEDLALFLPEERRSEFLMSDMRLRMEALRERLEGRKPLRMQLERFRPPEEEQESGEAFSLNPDSIESTLTFMGNLSTYLPNKEIGVALHHRIADIVKTMKRDSNGTA